MPLLTDHAKVQLKNRKITDDEVNIVLSGPRETVPTRANRLASFAFVHGKYIVVIHERGKDNKDDVIITAMRVNPRRLVRFGFTRI